MNDERWPRNLYPIAEGTLLRMGKIGYRLTSYPGMWDDPFVFEGETGAPFLHFFLEGAVLHFLSVREGTRTIGDLETDACAYLPDLETQVSQQTTVSWRVWLETEPTMKRLGSDRFPVYVDGSGCNHLVLLGHVLNTVGGGLAPLLRFDDDETRLLYLCRWLAFRQSMNELGVPGFERYPRPVPGN